MYFSTSKTLFINQLYLLYKFDAKFPEQNKFNLKNTSNCYVRKLLVYQNYFDT